MSRDLCYVTVIVGVAAHIEGLVLCYCDCRVSGSVSCAVKIAELLKY
jgi:hypothetical protein